MKSTQKIIGIDFDNTIVGYDNLFYELACERDLVAADISKNKRVIRDAVRLVEDGEQKWQELQAVAYGERMPKAVLFSGVIRFLEECKKANIQTFIVSHKTEFSSVDKNVNLRESATQWLDNNNLLENENLGITHSDVFFESTRIEKIERIKALNCTHFIDDLEETFLEVNFPDDVQKILFSSLGYDGRLENVKVCKNWDAIYEYFFSR